MPTRKIYVVSGLSAHANWMCGEIVSRMEDADLVVFPGGADVNPKLYGEQCHKWTRFDDHLDERDKKEFDRAKALGKKMVGICRGAQFLCVMAGGKLVQHQSNMKEFHPIYTYDGEVIKVSSEHHQAMYPWVLDKKKFEVLGWSTGLSLYHEGSDQKELVIGNVPFDMEVEVAFFPEIQALGIQAHPEWQYPKVYNDQEHKDAISYFRVLLNQFMDGHKFEESRNAYDLIPAAGT
jgi:gamma-glutamyl-gamma-aminobutyrate hydrolase PuuD